MKNLLYILIALVIFSSCGDSSSDPIPDEQEIVYIDTSGLTGELTVIAKYLDNDGQINNAPSGTSISLYASYDDLQNGLSLYNVFTNSNNSYFGYINYGNYYVTSTMYLGNETYYGQAAVQVRPDRDEELTITMY